MCALGDNLEYTHRKERLIFLDLIKIFSAIVIYMGHSIKMFGCSYGNQKLDTVVLAARILVMICFFVVSGFSIYYNNSEINILNTDNLKNFYIKRFMTIAPTYFLIHILSYILVDTSIRQAIYATPIDILCLQSMYGGLFGILHNGATWFISSLMLGYFVYPLVQELINANKNHLSLVAIIFFIIILYSEIVMPQVFGTPPGYVNPVFRAIQFSSGVVLCATLLKGNQTFKFSKMLLINLFIACILMTMFSFYNGMGKEYLILPAGCFLIFAGLIVSFYVRPKRLTQNRLIRYASGLSYYFFILQAFLWNIAGPICEFTGLNNNKWKILISFSLCVILSVLMNELFDKPVKKFLKRKLLKSI